ncbi:AlbA family DNA-binding domain-containing protein [Rhizobium phaseoli]|uniref:AlbA family DNA-binding domain-containing protein n=1 Tax=Rhizobium phaseoli TaxID=396 RepID=UPI00315CA4FF
MRSVIGKTADWGEVAKDCVAFANAAGGTLSIGIEDGENLPPSEQRIPQDFPDLMRASSRRGPLT